MMLVPKSCLIFDIVYAVKTIGNHSEAQMLDRRPNTKAGSVILRILSVQYLKISEKPEQFYQCQPGRQAVRTEDMESHEQGKVI